MFLLKWPSLQVPSRAKVDESSGLPASRLSRLRASAGSTPVSTYSAPARSVGSGAEEREGRRQRRCSTTENELSHSSKSRWPGPDPLWFGELMEEDVTELIPQESFPVLSDKNQCEPENIEMGVTVRFRRFEESEAC